MNYKNISKCVMQKTQKINDYFIISLIKNNLRIIATKVVKKFKNILKIRKFVSTTCHFFIRSNILLSNN